MFRRRARYWTGRNTPRKRFCRHWYRRALTSGKHVRWPTRASHIIETIAKS
jgi:hypothetical protein